MWNGAVSVMERDSTDLYFTEVWRGCQGNPKPVSRGEKDQEEHGRFLEVRLE